MRKRPAASRHAFFAGIGQCSDEAPICFGCMERIRALDAELAALEKGAVEGSWRARAEKAEAALHDEHERYVNQKARVKELEAELARHQDGERTAK